MQIPPGKQQELETFQNDVGALANKFYEIAMQEQANPKVVLAAAMNLIYASYMQFPEEDKQIVKDSILELFK